MAATTRDCYRILDANINRAKEGLRVCEEISRFHLKDTQGTKRFYALRHRLTRILNASRLTPRLLYAYRNAKDDPGKDFCAARTPKTFKAIFLANAQRVKEALRVCEEFLKLLDKDASRKIQRLRFSFYDLEKKTIERFPGLLDP